MGANGAAELNELRRRLNAEKKRIDAAGGDKEEGVAVLDTVNEPEGDEHNDAPKKTYGRTPSGQSTFSKFRVYLEEQLERCGIGFFRPLHRKITVACDNGSG